MQIDIAPFTLIGATTRSGLLSNPLRDRFMANFHYDFYEDDELSEIIMRNSKKLDLSLSAEAFCHLAARCSRGTPRIANRVLRRVRDYSVVNKLTNVGLDDVKNSLKLMQIDENGLDRMDRKIITTLFESFDGGLCGN